jgi:sugar phosphate isomerase/epimerase
MKPAFSTVACPQWTFPRLYDHLEQWGFMGCELRTFGYGSTQFACDPALTDAAKVRLGFEKAGVAICSLGTSLRYDEKFGPPVLASVIHDVDRSVRETKSLVDLAVQLECPLVRVFAFELPGGEPRATGLARVVDRLKKAADHCRNSGVTLMLENGGSFNSATDLAEILDAVDNPLLTACYSVPVALAAGESPAAGLNVLGDRCVCVKLKDLKHGQPCVLGEGELRCREAVDALAQVGFAGWVVYEFDRAWLSADEWDTDAVLTQSARTLYEWTGSRVAQASRP